MLRRLSIEGESVLVVLHAFPRAGFSDVGYQMWDIGRAGNLFSLLLTNGES